MKHRIQIFGQRCSGTNYLEQLLRANFKNIDIVNYYAFKHIWNANLIKEIKKEDNVKVIIIVRNPYDWLRSVHREPHHCPQLIGLSIDKFVKAPWVAYSKAMWNSANPEIRLRNIEQAPKIEEFENVVELRNTKNELFCQILKAYPKKVCLVNYEQLALDLNRVLSRIEDFYNLSRKNTDFIQISTYKDTEQKYAPKGMIKIDANTKKYIDDNLHFDLEKSLGYEKEDYKYSTFFDLQYYRFRLKQFFIKMKLYSENLDLAENAIQWEDLQRRVNNKKLAYRNLDHNQRDEKLDVLNEIFELDETNSWALLERAKMVKTQGEYNKALELIDLILSKEPNHVNALFQKGVNLMHLGNIEAALEYHEKVKIIRPDWNPNLKRLIALYTQSGSLDKAAELRRKISAQ